MAKDAKTWEFGDFQTPLPLAVAAVSRLCKMLSFKPKTIIEPTCGVGAFLIAAAEAFPEAEQIIGVEIDAGYLELARNSIDGETYANKVTLIQADFFQVNWAELLAPLPKPILVIGNPPWVTNADIGLIKGSNLPKKSNFQNRSGFDALTGKANFDISESMLLQEMNWIDRYGGAVAMLCKTAVARKILQTSWKAKKSVANSTCIQIDATAHFGASVDACYFIVERGEGVTSTDCAVFDSFEDSAAKSVFGLDSGMVIADMRAYREHRQLIGQEAHYVWRSGVKHDCSKVMELRRTPQGLQNGFEESISIEETYLFPLLKSSDVAKGSVHSARLMVIVTQQKIGENTAHIEHLAPRTWAYLTKHRDLLDKRGSVIYRGKPPFSIFGIGDYALKLWKVGISGFYKRLAFQLIPPHNGQPVMVDDTVYFLGCNSEAEARFVLELVTSDLAKGALESMVFWKDKRPITADLLKRLDLAAVAEALGRGNEYRTFTEQPVIQSSQLAFALG